jgi:CHAD domain-containing protein
VVEAIGELRSEPAVPHEIELKYAVSDVDAVRSWLDGDWAAELGDLTVGQPTVSEMVDRYFDTPHGALERHGFGARLRTRDETVTLTVKSKDPRREQAPVRALAGRGRARPLQRRIELEAPAADRLDPAAWPESPARQLVEELRGTAPLRTRFKVHQRRETRRVADVTGAAIISLDEVDVRMGRSHIGHFGALEVESTGDGTVLLERLAPVLARNRLLVPEPRSKDELAQALVEERAPHAAIHPLPPVPRAAGVRPEDTLAEAGRKVLRLHLARMLASEAGTRRGDDPEDLHKMRVATRRMRATWRVFDGAYRRRVVRRYVRELRGVATALGSVRDLDVQLDTLQAWMGRLATADAEATEPLRADWRGDREDARTRLIDFLDGRTYRHFVEDYLDFVETPGAGERAATPGEPNLVRDTAAGRIWIAYERVRAHDAILEWADAPALHALRIESKRLRYTLEAFSEVLPAARASSLIGAVTALQDHLGLLNDADVAARLVRGWLVANGSRVGVPVRQAVGQYLDSREVEVQRQRRSFGRTWRAVVGPSFRRSLALALAEV